MAAQAGAVVLPPVDVQVPLSGQLKPQSEQKISITFFKHFIHLANIREFTPNIFYCFTGSIKKGRMLNFVLQTIANAQFNKLLFLLLFF